MTRRLVLTILALVACLLFSAQVVTAQTMYRNIRINGDGEATIWRGHESGTPAGHRIVGVKLGTVSFKIHYTSDFGQIDVVAGEGYVEARAPVGAGFIVGEVAQNVVLTCTNQGVPPGSILCYCGYCEPPCECDDEDTGWVTEGATVLDVLHLN